MTGGRKREMQQQQLLFGQGCTNVAEHCSDCMGIATTAWAGPSERLHATSWSQTMKAAATAIPTPTTITTTTFARTTTIAAIAPIAATAATVTMESTTTMTIVTLATTANIVNATSMF